MLLERRNIPTIPSIEIGSKERIELLIFFRHGQDAENFFRQYIEPFRRKYSFSFLPLSLDYLMKAASDYEVLISIPHPFAPFWKNIQYGKKRRDVVIRTLNRADCIEVFNGTATNRANKKSFALCQALGRIPLAGSDSHSIKSIGSVGIDFDHVITSETLFDSIKNNQISGIYQNIGRPHHISNTCRLALNHSKKIVWWKDLVYQADPEVTRHKL
ncbi:MAG: hypothetical protein JRI95_14530 [Deltaproteobacteria bacterium]|nr:hypothetical protein [Deltaproteobacteria bacterium]